MPERIFITGATGNTGQAFLRLISRDESFREARITCLCRPGGRAERLLPFGVKIAGGDSSNAQSLKKVYGGEPTVIHISSIFHAPAVLEGCRGMERLIAVSSTRAYSETWERAKEIAAAERAVAESGIPFTILRPTMIYGIPEDRNISRFIRLVAKWPVVPLPGGGKTIFQPVHVEDLAACILAALRTPASVGKTYDIPGGSSHSLREIVSIISGALGKKTAAVSMPPGLVGFAAAVQGRLMGRRALRPEQIEGLREDKRYDYSEAARDLGFAPRSFKDGVAEQIRSMYPTGTNR